MITIIKADEEIHGPNVYSIKLNNHFICRFEHEKSNGLAHCLQQAADAVEQSEWADYILMDDSKGG